MSAKDFYVGLKLFVAFNDRRSGNLNKEMTITKIGRKWLTLGDGWDSVRVDADTMHLDGRGYSSPGDAYLSQEDWESSTELGKQWHEFKNRLPWSVPKGMTLERLAQIRTLIDTAP